jgi:hypothetical protein
LDYEERNDRRTAGSPFVPGSTEIKSDLNVMVQENGEVVRHSVLREPSGHLVREFLAFSGLSLEEIELAARVNRDVDTAHHGPT